MFARLERFSLDLPQVLLPACLLVLCSLLCTAANVCADEQSPPAPPQTASPPPAANDSTGSTAKAVKPNAPEANDVVRELAGISSEQFEELVSQTRSSVVVVTMLGRDGKPQGIGSGFVVSDDGLIATNLHVIGEARPIQVRLDDGRQLDVREIHGIDRTQDVALLRVAAEGLTPLRLAPGDGLKQGQPVFAVGNPQGLEHSVVTGVVSGFRDNADGMSLIQLAIPIERGNSGGPLLDMRGEVHGLLTLKSQVTENLGYAVKAHAVRRLIDAPRPIPMERWMTIGTLNARLWEPDQHVNWRQRAGIITVDGTAPGFGGRALCFSRQEIPELPFELAVDVKIQEADGAAGLVFHADGGDLHFGFYPSSGGLRLARFDGPSVYSWNVIEEIRTPHLRPDDWNRLKVRISADRIECYCNSELVIEHDNPRFTEGRVGLVKFRHTSAEFKRFELASQLPDEKPSAEVIARVRELATTLATVQAPQGETIQQFADLDTTGQRALQAEARLLEQRAARLRQLAREIHERRTREALQATLLPTDGSAPNLLRACLLVSLLDNPELDVLLYEREFEQLTADFLVTLPAEIEDREKLDRLVNYLFVDLNYHGSRTNYYNASNSYLNEVLDDREGLPLTLSILLVEMARRAGLQADGIGLPGHFIARVIPQGGEPIYLDAFEGGAVLTVAECRKKVQEYSGLPWNRNYLEPQPAHVIIQRMLRNLIRVSTGAEDLEASLRYVRTILQLDSDSVEDRLFKAVLCLNTDRLDDALVEVDWVLDFAPPNIDLRRVRDLRESITRKRESLQPREFAPMLDAE